MPELNINDIILKSSNNKTVIYSNYNQLKPFLIDFVRYTRDGFEITNIIKGTNSYIIGWAKC